MRDAQFAEKKKGEEKKIKKKKKKKLLLDVKELSSSREREQKYILNRSKNTSLKVFLYSSLTCECTHFRSLTLTSCEDTKLMPDTLSIPHMHTINYVFMNEEKTFFFEVKYEKKKKV
jgi:hypothetical protein